MQRCLKYSLGALLFAYLAILHVGLAAFVLSPELRASVSWRLPKAAEEKQTAFWRAMVGAQARLDVTLPQGTIIFLGDSGVQSLDVVAVADGAVNYGIGGDTILGVLRQLQFYPSLASARAIVLLVGSNDLVESRASLAAASYAELLSAMPMVPLVVTAVLPVDERSIRYPPGQRSNAEIAKLNAAIKALCAARSLCTVADPGPDLQDDTGNLARNLHEGDGMHLSPPGYRILIGALRTKIAAIKAATVHR